MKKVLLYIAVISTLLFTGCANMSSSDMTSKITDVKEALQIAQTKYAEAHKKGVAWKNTKAKLMAAKDFAKKGENSRALVEAKEAIYEATQALLQSKEAEKTWRLAVPQ